MNVTMMWVENIPLIFQYPKAPALPWKPSSWAVTVTAFESCRRSQTPKHQPAIVRSSHFQKMSWHWSLNEDESLMSIYVLERCTGFLTSVESFVKVNNSSLNSVEIVLGFFKLLVITEFMNCPFLITYAAFQAVFVWPGICAALSLYHNWVVWCFVVVPLFPPPWNAQLRICQPTSLSRCGWIKKETSVICSWIQMSALWPADRALSASLERTATCSLSSCQVCKSLRRRDCRRRFCDIMWEDIMIRVTFY